MNIDFSGKTIFLTGGSRGIGKNIKESFEKSGAIVIAPNRQELDLLEEKSVNLYLEQNQSILENGIDIFVHCAGMNQLAGVDEINESILSSVFQVNVFSPTLLLKKLVPYMKKEKSGKIVFVSSLYAIVSRERRIAYSASKNALTGLTKTLALELAPDNIMVNAVAPGYVLTDMTKQNLSEQEQEKIKTSIPTGRFQEEQEISDTIMFLCSDFNKSITGQIIAVDGGFLCR